MSRVATVLIGVSLSTASLVAADNDALQKPADNRFKIDVLACHCGGRFFPLLFDPTTV